MRYILFTAVVLALIAALGDVATCSMYGKAYGIDTHYSLVRCMGNVDGQEFPVAYHEILPF